MAYTKGDWQIHEQANWEQGDNVLVESIQLDPQDGVHKRTTPIATMTFFNPEANAHLIAQSPRMAEWIVKVAGQGFITFPEDRIVANEIIQTFDLS